LARLLGVMYINEALYFAVLSDRCLVDISVFPLFWHGIRIMCSSGATCLSADCCFSELAL
jgi:hypothetical protein